MTGINTNYGGGQPLSLSRAERAEKMEEALDQAQVKLGQMDGNQLAAHREYGAKLVDDIASARFNQPATGQSVQEFQELATRLTS